VRDPENLRFTPVLPRPPTFDTTPVVKLTKPKLIELRSALKERAEPFASLPAGINNINEQSWCSDNPLKFIKRRSPTVAGGGAREQGTGYSRGGELTLSILFSRAC
jgi:hypothetical protein